VSQINSDPNAQYCAKDTNGDFGQNWCFRLGKEKEKKILKNNGDFITRFRHLNLSKPSARRETETRETWLLSMACETTAKLLPQKISTTAKVHLVSLAIYPSL
jgi:hypothetical protein